MTEGRSLVRNPPNTVESQPFPLGRIGFRVSKVPQMLNLLSVATNYSTHFPKLCRIFAKVEKKWLSPKNFSGGTELR
jgi:hypothetical protein